MTAARKLPPRPSDAANDSDEIPPDLRAAVRKFAELLVADLERNPPPRKKG